MTAFELAQRWVGVKEAPGVSSNPDIVRMLRLTAEWPKGDEVPWCSAFVNFIAWALRLPRTKDLRARSWLLIGSVVSRESAIVGNDVVILTRGANQPGAEVIAAPGHVGFFAGNSPNTIHLLGGNQSDSVSVAPFPAERVLGVRRLA